MEVCVMRSQDEALGLYRKEENRCSALSVTPEWIARRPDTLAILIGVITTLKEERFVQIAVTECIQ
jgi:hypothetical protein